MTPSGNRDSSDEDRLKKSLAHLQIGDIDQICDQLYEQLKVWKSPEEINRAWGRTEGMIAGLNIGLAIAYRGEGSAPEGYWYIRNSDFTAIDEIIKAIVTLSASVVNPYLFFTSLIFFLVNVYRKTGWVAAEEAVVLQAIKQYPKGMVVSEVTEIVKSKFKGAAKDEWTEDKVLEMLRRLSNVRLQNNDIVPFVKELDKRWYVLNV
jgi:hypothetical protein